jgi:hypothetical protein
MKIDTRLVEGRACIELISELACTASSPPRHIILSRLHYCSG